MSTNFLPTPMSWYLGGIMRIAFPEAVHNLPCHHTPRGQLKPSVRSCPMFVCSGLVHTGDTCIQLSYFIYHVAVCFALSPIFFSFQLLSDVLASIIYPCTCCFVESAACWRAANMGFCFSWSALECEREATGGQCWLPAGPMQPVCQRFHRTC